MARRVARSSTEAQGLTKGTGKHKQEEKKLKVPMYDFGDGELAEGEKIENNEGNGEEMENDNLGMLKRRPNLGGLNINKINDDFNVSKRGLDLTKPSPKSAGVRPVAENLAKKTGASAFSATKDKSVKRNLNITPEQASSSNLAINVEQRIEEIKSMMKSMPNTVKNTSTTNKKIGK